MLIVVHSYDELFAALELPENPRQPNSINAAHSHINDEIGSSSVDASPSDYAMNLHVLDQQIGTLLSIRFSDLLY